MENATKALLIAAAVLVAILIISLGLVVYNKAAETVNNSGDLSEYEIQQFNQKFQKYEGTSVSASDVNAMLQTVFNHNLAQENDDTKVIVTYKDKAGTIRTTYLTKDQTSTPEKMSTGSRYLVEARYVDETNTSTKIIKEMSVTQN